MLSVEPAGLLREMAMGHLCARHDGTCRATVPLTLALTLHPKSDRNVDRSHQVAAVDSVGVQGEVRVGVCHDDARAGDDDQQRRRRLCRQVHRPHVPATGPWGEESGFKLSFLVRIGVRDHMLRLGADQDQTCSRVLVKVGPG